MGAAIRVCDHDFELYDDLSWFYLFGEVFRRGRGEAGCNAADIAAGAGGQYLRHRGEMGADQREGGSGDVVTMVRPARGVITETFVGDRGIIAKI